MNQEDIELLERTKLNREKQRQRAILLNERIKKENPDHYKNAGKQRWKNKKPKPT